MAAPTQPLKVLRASLASLPSFLTGPIARGAGVVLALRCANVALGFATTFMLARVMGAEQFGVFTYGASLAMLVSLASRLGFQPFLVRVLSGFHDRKNDAGFAGACLFALIVGGGAALLFSLAAFVAILTMGEPGLMRSAALIGVVIAPMITIVSLAQAFLRSQMQFIRAFAPEFIIVQMSLLAAAVFAALNDAATPKNILVCFGAAWGLAALFAIVWAVRTFPAGLSLAGAQVRWRSWLVTVIGMAVAGLFALLIGRIEPIALAAFRGAAEVGVYAVALRFSMLATFPGFAISSSLTPMIAQLHARGDNRAIARRLTLSARAGLAGVILASLGVMALIYVVLPYFGKDFAAARHVAPILLIGFILQAMGGRAYETLNMLGHVRQTVATGVVAIAAYITLIIMLVPEHGVVGAALATTIAVSLHAAMLAFLVWKKTRIRSDVFANLENMEKTHG